jgi:hypothetical protein
MTASIASSANRDVVHRLLIPPSFYRLMHGAAEEVDAGRLDPDQAADVLAASLMGVLSHQPR